MWPRHPHVQHNCYFCAGRTVLEVLQDFKSAQPPLEWLLQTVPHLKPRQFSIASSLAKHPNSAHVLMAVVDYKTPFKRRKQGLCSAWLASLTPSHSPCYSSDHAKQQVNDTPNDASADTMASDAASASSAHGAAVLRSSTCNSNTTLDVDAASEDKQACLVPVWVEKGVLRLPASHSMPMILIGPGTGVAPFRSFLEERQMAAAGRPLMSIDCFTACSHEGSAQAEAAVLICVDEARAMVSICA